MAGRSAALALSVILEIWESLIHGKYMKEALQYKQPPCPTCDSPKVCHNYFCLKCKTAGLCPTVFGGDHEHRHHPWLQVRHYTKRYSVLSTDLAQFINDDALKHIHWTIERKSGNILRHCNLTSKQISEPSSAPTRAQARVAGNKFCRGCLAELCGRRARGSAGLFLVCSLQCLVKVAHGRLEWDLLSMKDGVLGAMHPPLSFPEKLLQLNRPRMPQIAPASPVVAAPASPQVATGDPPMRQAPEIPTATPVVQAPPLPQATGNPSTLGSQEDLSEFFRQTEAQDPLMIDYCSLSRISWR